MVTSVAVVPATAVATPTGPDDGPAATQQPEGFHERGGPGPVPEGVGDRSIQNGTEVTLITGQTVTVLRQGNQTRYRTNASTQMERVSTPQGTYVYPKGTDFEKFDRDLFNVELLVQQNLTDAESESIPVIVQQKKPVASTGASELASASGGTAERKLESIDAASGSIAKRSASDASAELASNQYVDRVSLDVRFQINIRDATEAADAESARTAHDVTGEGVTVAVLDTGVDETHPAINGSEVDEKDFTGEGTTDDEFGHGTHVAAIITGNDSSGEETMTGVAPDAKILDVRVLDSRGGGTTSGIIDGMEYAQRNAGVISMSLGWMPREVRSQDPMTDAVNNATDKGTPVIAAAGNSNFHGTVGTPASVDGSLAVGATTDDGRVTYFSSRGPTAQGYKVKPELVANGELVRSADAGTEGYVRYNGTSMAAPVVSGTAALVLEKNPNAPPSELKARMASTSDPLGTGANVYEQGNGEVNATDAVGTDIYVTPGTVDFGLYTEETTDSRTITIHNDGDETRTLNATVEAKGLTTEGADDDFGPDGVNSNETGHAYLNRSQVTVAPGETETLKLTVATNVSGGVYGGKVSFDEGEYSTVFGYARAYNLTMEKKPLGSASDSSTNGDHATIASTGDNPLQAYLAPAMDFGADSWHEFSGGTVTVPVLDNETYWVMTNGVSEDTGDKVVLSEGVTVEGDTTATIDESNTHPVTVDASAIEAESGSLTDHTAGVDYARYIGWKGPGTANVTEFPETRTVRVSDDESLFLDVEYIMAETDGSPSNPSLNASDVYHITNETYGVENGYTHEVEPKKLDKNHIWYYRTNDTREYDLEIQTESGLRMYANPGGSFYRHEQTIHQSPQSNLDIKVSEPGASDGEWYFSASRRDPSSSFPHTFTAINRHPFHTSVYPWYESAGTLYTGLDVKEGAGVFETQLHDSGETKATLYVNGADVDNATTTDSSTELSGPISDGDSVRLRAQTNTSVPELSQRTTVEVNSTYNSSDSADTRPPVLNDVRVENATSDNYGSNETVPIEVRASDQSETTTQIWVAKGDQPARLPSREATHWQEATVTQPVDAGAIYEGRLGLEGYTGNLHVAVKVEDAAGNSYEMVIENGTRVKRLPPTAAGRVEPEDNPAEINETAVTLNATASSDNANTLKLFKWDFDGDGTVDETTERPRTTHLYDSFGTFTPTVEVVDWRGNNDTATLDTVTVQDTTPPEARILATTRSPDVNESVTFDATPSTDNDEIASHSWKNTGAPTKVERTEDTASVAYASEGRQQMNLTVTDASGNENKTTMAIYVGNEAPTVSASGATVDAGATANLDASGSTDPENHELSYEWKQATGPSVSLSSTSGTTTTFTAPDVSETTTVELEVTVTDKYGLSTTDTVAVEVQPTNSGGDDGGSGDDGSDDGGSDPGGTDPGGSDPVDDSSTVDSTTGGGVPPASGDQSTLEVNVSERNGSNAGAHVEVRNASDGGSVTVDLPDSANGRFTTIEVTTAEGGDFEFDVTESESVPNDESALQADTGHEAVGFANVEHGDVGVSDAEYTFTVSRERLDDIGATPGGVTLFRYEDGGWVAKSTTVENDSGAVLTFSGTSEGFSTYAIGAEPEDGNVAVFDAEVAEDEVEPSTDVEVIATVENEGETDASRTLGLVVEDEVLATQTVVVDAGESQTVAFTHVFEETGEYSLAVNETSAGTLRVAEIQQTPVDSDSETTDTATSAEGTESTEEQTTSLDAFGASVPVVPTALTSAALVAIFGLIWYRRL